jgi:hypothetical protein
MMKSVIIVDDFYQDVHDVRAFALSQPFDVKGNYPGQRTKSFLTDGVKQTISNLIAPYSGKVTNWNEVDGLTGSFQLTYSADRTWIHADNFNTWAAVCYLTPNAPLSGGTGLFRHKETGRRTPESRQDKFDYKFYDYTKWEMVDRIGNVYNRLIMYRGDFFHASLDYFGDDPTNGRLFQVFFFDTEY